MICAVAAHNASMAFCIAQVPAHIVLLSHRMLDIVIRQNFAVGCTDWSIRRLAAKLNNRIALKCADRHQYENLLRSRHEVVTRVHCGEAEPRDCLRVRRLPSLAELASFAP